MGRSNYAWWRENPQHQAAPIFVGWNQIDIQPRGNSPLIFQSHFHRRFSKRANSFLASLWGQIEGCCLTFMVNEIWLCFFYPHASSVQKLSLMPRSNHRSLEKGLFSWFSQRTSVPFSSSLVRQKCQKPCSFRCCVDNAFEYSWRRVCFCCGVHPEIWLVRCFYRDWPVLQLASNPSISQCAIIGGCK